MKICEYQVVTHWLSVRAVEGSCWGLTAVWGEAASDGVCVCVCAGAVLCVVVALALGSPVPLNTHSCRCASSARSLLSSLTHIMEKVRSSHTVTQMFNTSLNALHIFIDKCNQSSNAFNICRLSCVLMQYTF